MKLGIMQPYFFPYLGYYDLINRTDRWVVFDVVKYSPRSWMNRNRILHPSAGWQYISVPVDRHLEDGLIKDVLIVDKEAVRRRILGQIDHYRVNRAPYFEPVRALVDECFRGLATDRLRDLNVRSLAVMCAYLGVRFDPTILSETGLQLGEIHHAGQWALEISAAMGASEYINPPSGRSLFAPEEFARRGIALTFTELIEFRYPCAPYDFVEHLSIVDVLMWNASAAVQQFLDQRRQAAP